MTRIYALVISNWRTAGTLTFVKTMAVFATVCHVLLYTAIFAFVYQMLHIFPALREQCKKLKHGTFAGYTPAMSRDWLCGEIRLVYYTYWERAHLQQKSDA